jgi:hypothetical protein
MLKIIRMPFRNPIIRMLKTNTISIIRGYIHVLGYKRGFRHRTELSPSFFF